MKYGVAFPVFLHALAVSAMEMPSLLPNTGAGALVICTVRAISAANTTLACALELKNVAWQISVLPTR